MAFMKKRPRQTMDPVASVLADYLDEAGLREFSDYIRVMRAWKDIVGPVISARSMPASLVKGELVIIVRESVWANELSLLQSELRKKIHTLLGIIVHTVRTRIGEVPEPAREKSAHTPRTGPPPPWVDDIVRESGITDTTLREQFKRVVASYERERENT